MKQSLTIPTCLFEEMEQRISNDPRLTELLLTTVAAIMTECYPGVTPTPELFQRSKTLQEMMIAAFALLDAENWPSRHSGDA